MDHEGVFLAFLANIGSRELPRFLSLGPPSTLCPRTAGGLESPTRPPAAGNNGRWSLHIPQRDLQTTDSGKNIPILMGKPDLENSRKNGKNSEKIVENSVRTLRRRQTFFCDQLVNFGR